MTVTSPTVVRPLALALMTAPPPALALAEQEGGRWDPVRQITVGVDGDPRAVRNALTTLDTRRRRGETIDEEMLAGRWW